MPFRKTADTARYKRSPERQYLATPCGRALYLLRFWAAPLPSLAMEYKRLVASLFSAVFSSGCLQSQIKNQNCSIRRKAAITFFILHFDI
jgi:hypothetical protein